MIKHMNLATIIKLYSVGEGDARQAANAMNIIPVLFPVVSLIVSNFSVFYLIEVETGEKVHFQRHFIGKMMGEKCNLTAFFIEKKTHFFQFLQKT